jgi:hypothetical protein
MTHRRDLSGTATASGMQSSSAVVRAAVMERGGTRGGRRAIRGVRSRLPEAHRTAARRLVILIRFSLVLSTDMSTDSEPTAPPEAEPSSGLEPPQPICEIRTRAQSVAADLRRRGRGEEAHRKAR